MKQGKNRRWTTEEDNFIRENYGKMSFEDMATRLGRSAMSVRLYALRRRITLKPVVKRNLLMEMLKIKFRHSEEFTPSRAFYMETGIGQRRWWDLYYGRKPITSKEYSSVASYLGLTIQEAVEARQLDLFNEERKYD